MPAPEMQFPVTVPTQAILGFPDRLVQLNNQADHTWDYTPERP
jgi:hypothetical protein